MADIRLRPGEGLWIACSPLASDFGDLRDPETHRRLRKQVESITSEERDAMLEAECRRRYPERYR
jgi:hypothetical protein